MRCVARAPGAGGSTRKQFSIHIAQLLFDKHNYHPRLVTVKLLAAAVCIVPHCCATLVSISWWEPPDIRHQTSPHHTVTLRNVGWCCVTRDSWDDAAWQLRWCCVTAEVMLRDTWQLLLVMLRDTWQLQDVLVTSPDAISQTSGCGVTGHSHTPWDMWCIAKLLCLLSWVDVILKWNVDVD